MSETQLQPAKNTAPKKNDFVHLANGNITGTLRDGIQVGKETLKEFEMRPCTAGDMFDAELDASPEYFLAYRGALIARQLVHLGDLKGPIDFQLLRSTSPRDVTLLIAALDEVEKAEKKDSNV